LTHTVDRLALPSKKWFL